MSHVSILCLTLLSSVESFVLCQCLMSVSYVSVICRGLVSYVVLCRLLSSSVESESSCLCLMSYVSALTIIRRASTERRCERGERRCERGESNPTVDCLWMFIATTLAHTLSPDASCVAVCCCVLQCVAVCCCVAVLQCVAVCAHTLSQETSRHEH